MRREAVRDSQPSVSDEVWEPRPLGCLALVPHRELCLASPLVSSPSEGQSCLSVGWAVSAWMTRTASALALSAIEPPPAAVQAASIGVGCGVASPPDPLGRAIPSCEGSRVSCRVVSGVTWKASTRSLAAVCSTASWASWKKPPGRMRPQDVWRFLIAGVSGRSPLLSPCAVRRKSCADIPLPSSSKGGFGGAGKWWTEHSGRGHGSRLMSETWLGNALSALFAMSNSRSRSSGM